mmetsp:Transcript_10702/g.21653  ORF Transcript_10702/g.21653 Transcript_10702/m.21653 type:complete len:212 (-) Transcript_10702:267-902(-)
MNQFVLSFLLTKKLIHSSRHHLGACWKVSKVHVRRSTRNFHQRQIAVIVIHHIDSHVQRLDSHYPNGGIVYIQRELLFGLRRYQVVSIPTVLFVNEITTFCRDGIASMRHLAVNQIHIDFAWTIMSNAVHEALDQHVLAQLPHVQSHLFVIQVQICFVDQLDTNPAIPFSGFDDDIRTIQQLSQLGIRGGRFVFVFVVIDNDCLGDLNKLG